jgi:hypothetical protein
MLISGGSAFHSLALPTIPTTRCVRVSRYPLDFPQLLLLW